MATTVIVEPKTLVERFTSRKFIAAVFGAILGVLVAAGVIDASVEQTALAEGLPLAYLLVEGALDYVNRGN